MSESLYKGVQRMAMMATRHIVWANPNKNSFKNAPAVKETADRRYRPT